MQRCHPQHIPGIHIAAVLQQQLADLGVAFVGAKASQAKDVVSENENVCLAVLPYNEDGSIYGAQFVPGCALTVVHCVHSSCLGPTFHHPKPIYDHVFLRVFYCRRSF